MSAPVLFVPASGPTGSGEYYRCLALARALKRRSPDLEIAFVLNRSARVERDPAFACYDIGATPARAGSEVAALLEQIRPALAVFDCTGRVAHFRQVRRQGGQVVWVSNRPNKRRRGFSLRVLRWIGLHLMADQPPGAPRLSRRERLALRLAGSARVVSVGVIAPETEAPAGPAQDQGQGQGAYAVFVAGGGGYRHAGRPVPEIFLDAALAFRRRTGLAAKVVLGPQYTGSVTGHDEVEVIGSLPTLELSRLLAGAELAVVGAGYMLSSQALSVPTPAVVVAVGGSDQPERVKRLDRAGLAEAARLDSEDMAARAARLVEEDGRGHRQRLARESAGVSNAVGPAAEALLELIDSQ